MRRTVFGLLAAVALLALGCGAREAGDGPAVAEDTGPSGTLVMRNLREASLTVVDLGSMRTEVKQVPELAPGDALYHIVRTGGRLVLYGGGATTRSTRS